MIKVVLILCNGNFAKMCTELQDGNHDSFYQGEKRRENGHRNVSKGTLKINTTCIQATFLPLLVFFG